MLPFGHARTYGQTIQKHNDSGIDSIYTEIPDIKYDAIY